MHPKHKLFIGVIFLVLLAALAAGQIVLEKRTVAEAAGKAFDAIAAGAREKPGGGDPQPSANIVP